MNWSMPIALCLATLWVSNSSSAEELRPPKLKYVPMPVVPATPSTNLFFSLRTPVKPGLYESAPYTGLVLVPPPIDDKIALPGAGIERSPMPRITPELRLIPRK